MDQSEIINNNNHSKTEELLFEFFHMEHRALIIYQEFVKKDYLFIFVNINQIILSRNSCFART